MTIVVSYGYTGQRVTCPHRDEAAPAGAVTVDVLDSDGEALITDGAATKGALSTTLAAAASAGARSITVASSTGVSVGDPIVIADSKGRSEVHTVEGVTTGVIALKDRLARAYAITTTTVKSGLIYYSLNASDTDVYTVGTHFQAVFECSTWTAPRAVIFRVADLATANPITFDDVKRWLPHASVMRDSYDSAGLDEARDMAWQIISTRIEAAGRDPLKWRDSDRVKALGGLLAAGLFCVSHGQLEMAMQLVGDPPGAGGIYAGLWSDTARLLLWFDEDNDRSIDRGEIKSFAPIRLRRGL